MVLPRCLNPAFMHVDSPSALPLCWYCVPFLTDNLLELAVRLKVAVPDARVPGAFDYLGSLQRLQDEVWENAELNMDFREVWSTRGPIWVLTFFSNRECETITWGVVTRARLFIRALKYPEDMDLKWYPDIHEDVSGLRLFGRG